MESSEDEIEAFGPSLSEDLILLTFPFSALVPAVLEARNKLLIACKVDNGKAEACEEEGCYLFV